MPWNPKDATRHTKKAATPAAREQWSAVANRLLASGAPEGAAIRQANGVIKKRRARRKRSAAR
jgi:hypothetical protein